MADLVAEGYLERRKVGRRNAYRVNPDGALRHPLESHQTVGGLLAAVSPEIDPADPDSPKSDKRKT